MMDNKYGMGREQNNNRSFATSLNHKRRRFDQ